MKNTTLNNIVSAPAVAYKITGTPIDLISIARRGISKKALLELAKILDLSLKEIANLLPITERTIQRKRPENVFGPAVSEQIILISKLTDKGVEVLGIEPFKKWLKKENTALGANKPMDLLDTTIGIQMVEDVLGRLSYGVYS